MKIINLLINTFFLTTLLGLSCCHVTKKMPRENSEADETQKDKLIQKPYISKALLPDTTYKLYHLEHDTLFIGKKYPPEGFRMTEETMTDDFYWLQKESNEIKAIVRSCFRPDRLEILIQNHSGLTLYHYVNQAGIIQEVEIRINDKNKNYISDEEIKCICNKLKGFKIFNAPEHSLFPWIKLSQAIWFR